MRLLVLLSFAGVAVACRSQSESRPSRDERAADADARSVPFEPAPGSTVDATSPVDTGSDDELTRGMVLVPEGSFFAGCEDDGPEGPCDTSMVEQPMSIFFIDRTEVTVAAFRACVEHKRCTEPMAGRLCDARLLNWTRTPSALDSHPVNCVTPAQAETYCRWRGMHLPTSMQFEKAARGMADKRKYPWGDEPPSCERVVMNEDLKRRPASAGCGKGRTWPVGSRPAGAIPFGVTDLSGNVNELVFRDNGGEIDASSVNVDVPLERLGALVHTQGGDFDSGGRVEIFALGGATSSAQTGFRCVYVPPTSPEWKRIRARFVF